ncbi:MAG: hypothetical protein Q8M83_06755 [bacterium]|nr:hypothetical protein [bacterium]
MCGVRFKEEELPPLPPPDEIEEELKKLRREQNSQKYPTSPEEKDRPRIGIEEEGSEK